MDQKLEFAEQLQAPMHIAGLESRPAVLFNLFNTHKWGRSVTFQAVSRWLRDESIPGQDELIDRARGAALRRDCAREGAETPSALGRRQGLPGTQTLRRLPAATRPAAQAIPRGHPDVCPGTNATRQQSKTIAACARHFLISQKYHSEP